MKKFLTWLIIGFVAVIVLFGCKKGEDDNNPPSASFISPTESIIGHKVMFDARESIDPDGDIKEYRWNFGDKSDTTIFTSSVFHIYTDWGIYLVTLEVADEQGWTDQCEKYIIIREK